MSNVAKKRRRKLLDTRRDLVDPVVCRLAHAGGRPCNGLWDEDSLHLCGVDVWLDLSGPDLSKFSFGGTGGNRQWGTGKHVLLCRVLQRDCCRYHCTDDFYRLRQQGWS